MGRKMLDNIGCWGTSMLAVLASVIPFVRMSPKVSRTSNAESLQPILPGKTKRPLQSTAVRAIRIPQLPLSAAIHFERVGTVVTQAIRSARVAVDMQDAVRQQLEVIEFSIDRIFDEVAEVMALTPEMATIRQRYSATSAPHLRIAA